MSVIPLAEAVLGEESMAGMKVATDCDCDCDCFCGCRVDAEEVVTAQQGVVFS